VREFAAAVERVAAGGCALDPEVVSRLVGRKRSDDPFSQLTPREREVLELMAQGRSSQAVAEKSSSPFARPRSTSRASSASCGSLPTSRTTAGYLAVLTYLRQ
jgi:hypothetical protein